MKECTKTAYDNLWTGIDFLCDHIVIMHHIFLFSHKLTTGTLLKHKTITPRPHLETNSFRIVSNRLDI